MTVKRRPNPPEPVLLPETREEVVIKIGDKEYPLPTLTYGEYRKLIKSLEVDNAENMTEEELMEVTRDFYYKLLHPHYPELKKSDLDDMPVYQFGTEFVINLKLQLFRVPLNT